MVKKLRPMHPGEVLREDFLIPLGLSAGALAKACAVPRTRIERIANEETSITADTAARLGKALVWRTLDDGRAIYDRKLAVDEVRGRIDRFHRPYHAAVRDRIAATHARFGASWHINCHSMNAVSGAQGEGGAGRVRADFVVGDRDGTTCDAAFTELVRSTLAGMGYDVRVNDPYKGVELVRAYSNPAEGRMSLQLEINKRLYMDEATRTKSANFERLQRQLLELVDAILDYTKSALGARAARR